MPHENSGNLPSEIEILIVGAGMAGLTAARELVSHGRQVLVVDKGWNCGGRMATRRIGNATFDHGASFVMATAGPFEEALAEWAKAGAVVSWGGLIDGESHWRGSPSMRALPEYLARDLQVVTRTTVTALNRMGDHWQVALEGDEQVEAKAVILTPPVPQTRALLEAGGFALSGSQERKLARIKYERCLAVLAVLDGPTRVPEPGLVEPDAGPIRRIVDNRMKGVSAVTAVTILSTPEFGVARWDDDRDAVAAELLAAGAPWLGAEVVEYQVHGWRFSRPTTTGVEPCLVIHGGPDLILAGDAFGGPDVPGAYRSGLAAAAALGALTMERNSSN